MTSLDEAIARLRELADRRKRLASRVTRPELYSILEQVYAIRLMPEDEKAFLDHIVEARKAEGANRAWTISTNRFTLPLRYIFPAVSDRSNVSRYAGALTELQQRQVEPERFREGVRACGGLTELYWAYRERTTKKQVRQRIILDRTITVVSGQLITLRLLPTVGGIFKVLEQTNE